MSKLKDALNNLQDALTERDTTRPPVNEVETYESVITEYDPEIKTAVIVEVFPYAGLCEARQYSDQMCCGRCGLQWDVNDPEPPKCSP